MTDGFALSGASANRSPNGVQDASDKALIERIAARDQTAMRTLFARYNVVVYRFVLRQLADPSLAEDLVSEVFLDVWRHAARFEGRCRVSTWLLAIARYKTLSSMRARGFAPLDDRLAESVEDPADNPEVAAQRTDRSAILRRCLTQLSAAHREIVDLVYYHEKTIEEVAAIVGSPQNTVKTRMFHARRRLAELLTAAGLDHAMA
jgi:RNA polymerase sigma-70 factor, ECF subfamily